MGKWASGSQPADQAGLSRPDAAGLGSRDPEEGRPGERGRLALADRRFSGVRSSSRTTKSDQPLLSGGLFPESGPRATGEGHERVWLLSPGCFIFVIALLTSPQAHRRFLSVFASLLSSHTKCKLQEGHTWLCLRPHPETPGPRAAPGKQQAFRK